MISSEIRIIKIEREEQVNLKRLHIVQCQVYDILEKAKVMETIKISVVASEGGRNRQSTEVFFKIVKYSI